VGMWFRIQLILELENTQIDTPILIW
jgi:hypothetical protein